MGDQEINTLCCANDTALMNDNENTLYRLNSMSMRFNRNITKRNDNTPKSTKIYTVGT